MFQYSLLFLDMADALLYVLNCHDWNEIESVRERKWNEKTIEHDVAH